MSADVHDSGRSHRYPDRPVELRRRGCRSVARKARNAVARERGEDARRGDLPDLVIAQRQPRARPDAGLDEIDVPAAIDRHAGGPFEARVDGLFAVDRRSSVVPARRGRDDSVGDHADSAVAEVRDVQVSRAVRRDVGRQRDAGARSPGRRRR